MLPCTPGDIVSVVSCALSCINCWRMARILPATWNVDFVLVDEREKNIMQKIQVNLVLLEDDEMSIETYIQMEGEENTELELGTDELLDDALRTNFAQDFDLNVDLDLVAVKDVASPKVKLSDAKRHASLLSSFLLENTLNFSVTKIISFQN